MVKHTSLGHLKCWLLWAVDDKLIPILSVVGHRVIFLDQAKGQERIIISWYITNLVGVCHSCVTMDT